MSNTKLSRIERAQRRCHVDDLVVLAQALRFSPIALLQGSTPFVRSRSGGGAGSFAQFRRS